MKTNPLKLRHVLFSSLPFPRISPKPHSTLPPLFHTPQTPTPNPSFPIRLYHFTPPLSFSLTQNDAVPITQSDTEEEDETLNEFLSRFAHKMRAHLSTAYPHCDKQTVNAMLGIIIEKVLEQSGGTTAGEGRDIESELSQDLWRTVEEVSASVYTEMEKERNKERMKLAYQTDEGVKAMTRFASEVGVRGDLLRELRFKWAKEAIERQDFYESLEQYREEGAGEGGGEGVKGGEGKKREVELRRKGKVKYSVYGLDLSGEEWREVSEKVHEAEEMLEVKEKEMTGKAKTVMDMIVGFEKEVEEEEMRRVVSEWVELVSPRKVDWVVLLGKVKNKDIELYLKV